MRIAIGLLGAALVTPSIAAAQQTGNIRMSMVPPWAIVLNADVESGFSLSSDGLGTYRHDRDGSVVFGGDAGSIVAWRGVRLLDNSTVDDTLPEPRRRRSLTFDLRRPVAGTGAVDLGVVTDSIGRFHAFWAHDSTTRKVRSFISVPKGPAIRTDRVELWVRANGHQYVLQFGPWGMGLYSDRARITGAGTTPAAIERVSDREWWVRSGPSSVGRLWLVDDIDNPVDKGLYHFSFSVRFER